jgi:hypothetical protein
MPARDRQDVREYVEPRQEEEAGLADNPLHEAPAGAGVEGSPAPLSARAMREVWGTTMIIDAIFLGAGSLALFETTRVTLHSLLVDETEVVPVTVVERSATMTATAASGDGAALCLGDTNGWLAVFDVDVPGGAAFGRSRFRHRGTRCSWGRGWWAWPSAMTAGGCSRCARLGPWRCVTRGATGCPCCAPLPSADLSKGMPLVI